MAEWRGIRKKICLSKRVNALRTDSACLLYTWLLLFADKEGNCMGDLDDLKHNIMPKRKRMTEKFMLECLKDMDDKGLIIPYMVEDRPYIHIVQYKKQTPGLREDREIEEYPKFKEEMVFSFNSCPAKPGEARQSPQRIDKTREEKKREEREEENENFKFNAFSLFFDRYEYHQKKKYVCSDKSETGKQGKLLKSIIEAIGPEAYKTALERFFTSKDTFAIKCGYNVTAFHTLINNFTGESQVETNDDPQFVEKDGYYYILNNGDDTTTYPRDAWEKMKAEFEAEKAAR